MSFRNALDPPPDGPLLHGWLKGLKDVVGNILRGKLNCTGTVTLTPSVATTTITDGKIGGGTVVLLQPLTAHAAAELGNGTLYFNPAGNGTVVINHANSAQTDRNFNYVLIG